VFEWREALWADVILARMVGKALGA
jgi:hypothetical protein